MSNEWNVVDRDAGAVIPFAGQTVTYTLENGAGERIATTVDGGAGGDYEGEMRQVGENISDGRVESVDD